MRRTVKRAERKPTAILTSDIHMTETVPVSRTDDYLGAQLVKLEFLNQLQEEYGCPVWDSGDLFDYWKASPWLMSRAYETLPYMITIPGNHDLPAHNITLFDKSALAHIQRTRGDVRVIAPTEPGMGSVHQMGDEYVIVGLPYGQLKNFDPDALFNHPDFPEGIETFVLMLHEFVWPGSKPPWKGAPGYSAGEILERFGPYFDLILTGDNHSPFVEELDGAILVNPGGMMRDTAAMVDDRPRCYLYYAEDNSVEPVYYPIVAGVHDISYLTTTKERDARLEAYISNMKEGAGGAHGLSFENNLEAFFKANNTPRKVRELIWHHMEV